MIYLQRFNASTLQRFNASTLQRTGGSQAGLPMVKLKIALF
jgi:hypothetical protein